MESWALLLKGVVYILAFWIFGWRFSGRKPLPSLGWAILGGIGRWLSGVVLGVIGFVFLSSLGLPFGILVAFLALFRLCIWAMLAAFLYEPKRKPLVHFAVIMTMLNFAMDLLLFGPLKPSEFREPVRWGAWH